MLGGSSRSRLKENCVGQRERKECYINIVKRLSTIFYEIFLLCFSSSTGERVVEPFLS